MTAVTLERVEGAPASYPASGQSPEPDNARIVWQRIESYTAYRWSARAVLWIVEGPGEWVPLLTPFFLDTSYIWQDSAWVAVTLDDSPLGGSCLPGCGPYKFTGTVGEDGADVPDAVIEAFTRLSDYLIAARHRPGLRAIGAGQVSATYNADETSYSMALQKSGAADLLRPYRRSV